MKNLLTIGVLVLFVYIQLYNGMVWLTYEINKSEIIEKFCENKSKPELQCEGSCHMKKMMLKKDNEDQKDPSVTIPEIQLFSAASDISIQHAVICSQMETPYVMLSGCFFNGEIEIPPKV